MPESAASMPAVEETGRSAGYLTELRANVRPLAAATLGAGTSLPLFTYTNGVFAPHLIKQFGWSKAQFALIGITMLASVVVLPVIGRLTDVLGVRRVALIGTIIVPFCFVAYAMQQGSFAYFVTVFTAVVVLGNLTSPMVYSRLVASRFQCATGLALTIMNCFPAALAVGLVPVLNWSIETWGWRPAYLAIGLISLIGGACAILLIEPDGNQSDRAIATPNLPRSSARQDFSVILRSGLFWLIAAAMFLCLLITPLHTSLMSLMLIDNHISTQTAAFVISVYSIGTIVGRIACGLALDRFSTPVVTFVSMAFPSIGLFVLGTDWNAVPVIAVAMFLVGLTVGAESDLLAYLVARYFKIEIYSSTFSMIACVNYLASFAGSVAISVVLDRTGSFSNFLFLVSGTVALGSVLFLFLPGRRHKEKIG